MAMTCYRRERADMYLLPLGSDSLRPPMLPSLHGSSSSGFACAPGLFGRLAGLGLGVEVQMSSVHPRTPRDRTRLFDFQEVSAVVSSAQHQGSNQHHGSNSSPAQMVFGTLDPIGDRQDPRRQPDPEEQPWIEILAKDCEVSPTAVGLRHGWSESLYCKTFVVEAMRSSPSSGVGFPVMGTSSAISKMGEASGGGDAVGAATFGNWGTSPHDAVAHRSGSLERAPDRPSGSGESALAGGATSSGGEWVPLLSRSDHQLSSSGDTFPLECKSSSGGDWVAYDRFRIRMTGPNDSGSWHLMVRWFDVFGQFRAKPSYFMGEGCRIEATL